MRRYTNTDEVIKHATTTPADEDDLYCHEALQTNARLMHGSPYASTLNYMHPVQHQHYHHHLQQQQQSALHLQRLAVLGVTTGPPPDMLQPATGCVR